MFTSKNLDPQILENSMDSSECNADMCRARFLFADNKSTDCPNISPASSLNFYRCRAHTVSGVLSRARDPQQARTRHTMTEQASAAVTGVCASQSADTHVQQPCRVTSRAEAAVGVCRPRSGSFTVAPSAHRAATHQRHTPYTLSRPVALRKPAGFSISELISEENADDLLALDLSSKQNKLVGKQDSTERLTDTKDSLDIDMSLLPANSTSEAIRLCSLMPIKKRPVSSGSPLVRSLSDAAKTFNSLDQRRLSESIECFTSANDSKIVHGNCPKHKRIPDTKFVVDAFCYSDLGPEHTYFLTHFHYSHYRGLSSSFRHRVYCSHVTGNLIEQKLQVPSVLICRLSMHEPVTVDGVQVSTLNANHCPGSVMFHFKLTNGRCVLHVGHFRADHLMESYPILLNSRISTLFLDTTYCDPVFDFPSQTQLTHTCTSLCVEALGRQPRTLLVCGCYTLGKEQMYLRLADLIDCKFWACEQKLCDLRLCLADTPWASVLLRRATSDPYQARLHVLPYTHITVKTLRNYLCIYQSQYSHILALKPTGWESARRSTSRGEQSRVGLVPTVCEQNISIYGVPYSDHSSFPELRRFVRFIRPESVVATVHTTVPAELSRMQKHFEQWLE